MEEYVLSGVDDFSYVMKWQVVIPTLLNVGFGESDARNKSDTANDVDTRPAGK